MKIAAAVPPSTTTIADDREPQPARLLLHGDRDALGRVAALAAVATGARRAGRPELAGALDWRVLDDRSRLRHRLRRRLGRRCRRRRASPRPSDRARRTRSRRCRCSASEPPGGTRWPFTNVPFVLFES